MSDAISQQGDKRYSSFVIVIFPNVLFFILLGIILLLFFLLKLPWLFFPGYDVTFPLRLIELIVGYLLSIGGLYFFTWGLTTITRVRASGKEIGESNERSTLITTGAFAVCRHPITLGFVLLLPGFSLIFDLIPLILLYEEKELTHRFGKKYLEYRSKVPLLLPRIILSSIRKENEI
jgi:protein-S-isoprenylcysteine O-methyltransferase Ste14